MNWDQVSGNWKQFKGKVKEKWGKLTDDDLDVIAGKRDQLIGRMQERYGITKEAAEKEIKDWESTKRWLVHSHSQAAPGMGFFLLSLLLTNLQLNS
jgi:uncharacterized protein YjbJ (UPF0337 family)